MANKLPLFEDFNSEGVKVTEAGGISYPREVLDVLSRNKDKKVVFDLGDGYYNAFSKSPYDPAAFEGIGIWDKNANDYIGSLTVASFGEIAEDSYEDPDSAAERSEYTAGEMLKFLKDNKHLIIDTTFGNGEYFPVLSGAEVDGEAVVLTFTEGNAYGYA